MRASGARARRAVLFAFAAAVVAACGSDGSEEGEDYGNLLASPAGLVLTREEHPGGWQRPDCSGCHESRNIHQVNRTHLPDCDAAHSAPCIDLAEVRAFVRDGGDASCSACHGENGVMP